MAKKVREILLVSTPYDAWVMEEDCRLSERIINEYRGLNLSHPPRLTWVPTAEEALASLEKKKFDMVITMPKLADMDAFVLGREIKRTEPDLPVILLSHGLVPAMDKCVGYTCPPGIDNIFVWSGNTDILVALVKSTEDLMNVGQDTLAAGIRVILYLEDSPYYVSSILPILYKELVSQTQAVIEEGLNEEHRLLTMRARPKILVARSYEEAMALFERFGPYLLGVISDIRISREGQLDDRSGIDFLSHVKKERFDIPLLMTSAEKDHGELARKIPAIFAGKNSHTLHQQVRSFLGDHLGFGEFIFRKPDGREIARASNLRFLEKHLRIIDDDCLVSHCNRNDFSRWLFARTEIMLAEKVRTISGDDFKTIRSHRDYLISTIETRRKRRQKGVVTNFNAAEFDEDTEFFKIGQGSLGGKARGIAFVSSLLRAKPDLQKIFDTVNLKVPQTLVVTTEGFESFIETNDLRGLSKSDLTDEQIADAFAKAIFPKWIESDLRCYLENIRYPLAIRSSSLLEDAQFRAYAGLYRTYMISNDHPELDQRLAHLIRAIKLVYASTYFKGPRAFSKRVGQRTEEEQMAVIIQQMVGEQYGDSFYPAISGVAQSHNYYPFSQMKPEDGISTVAMGLGKTVVEGEKTLRFSPKYPQVLPQRSTVEDILDNSQRFFYSLKMENTCHPLTINDSAHLNRREISDAEDETPMKILASTFVPEENRIRDTVQIPGYRVLTFSHILKYKHFPLAEILSEALTLGQDGMGCPVELEFSVNLCQTEQNLDCKPEFAFLQLRPMTARAELLKIDISPEEISAAFCYSTHALGNTENQEMSDILLVNPEKFDPAMTMEIAREIGNLNAELVQQNRKYILVGPGRWGSADRWLGIPVTWEDISGVGAMVETASEKIKADPSQGSHFFHNITTLGINYITVKPHGDDFFNVDWVLGQSNVASGNYIDHISMRTPIILKVDGSKSCGILYS
ncbi:MAG: hypothetical protein HKM93_16415 [Desulfobacteraceae bacterium]|nr:hypothetical protein [Desulfobacteraceae bacterium]